ncbi:MAG: hypothetical protein AAGF12_34365, partial [Myxococcota bacterium]
RARIAGRSIDIPTTTSERFLRSLGLGPGPSGEIELPEEDRVVTELGSGLGLSDREAAEAALAALHEELEGLDGELQDRETTVDDAYHDLRVALVERWPGIEDPWRDDHPRMLQTEGTAIEDFLNHDSRAEVYRRALEDLQPLEQRLQALGVREALLQRLVRAHETGRLARRLIGAGGADAAAYRRLLVCERTPWTPLR